MKTYLLLLLLSFLFSVLFTRWVRQLARHFGWLDHPNARKVHATPIPRLGGVAICLALVAGTLPLLLIHNRVTDEFRIQWPTLEPLLPAIAAVFLLGVVDDIIGVKPYIKLLVEIAASLWVFFHGVFVGVLASPAGGPVDIGSWALPVTVLWLVGITNAFNLVDGIDGLASGIALFALATMLAVSLFSGNAVIVAVFIALAGATAGFLCFNFHPASIFLGDSGSLFLGFTLGCLAIQWGEKSSLAVAMVGPILLFALPIADTALAIFRRFVNGSPLFGSDRNHIHHQLLKLGWGTRKVVLLLYAACFLFSGITLFLVHTQTGFAVFVLIPVFLCCWYGLSQLGYHELGEINLTVRRGFLQQRGIIGQRVKMRKLTEAMAQAASLQELWKRILEITKAFAFDSAELILSPEFQARLSSDLGIERGSEPFGIYWSEEAMASLPLRPSNYWQVEVTCGATSHNSTRLILRRAVKADELHLRLDPFLRQMSDGLSNSLARIRTQPEQAIAAATAVIAGVPEIGQAHP